jgi:hypothetical protein
LEDRVDPKGALGAGGSVATTAWDFCRAGGASKIFVSGLDLSQPDYRNHFRGALFEEKAAAASSRFETVEGRNSAALRSGGSFYARGARGARVLTDNRLDLYARWFNAAIPKCPAPTFIISGSEGCPSYEGLALRGAQNTSVEDALALPEIAVELHDALSAVFAKIDSEFDDSAAISARDRAFRNALRELQGDRAAGGNRAGDRDPDGEAVARFVENLFPSREDARAWIRQLLDDPALI